MQGETDPGQPQPANLLDHHRAVEKIGRHAAVFFRDMRAEHARLARLVPQLAVDMPILFPLRMKGHGLLLEKLAYAVTEKLMV
ncbi:hypothetical protein D3C71_1898070 [compost metagenome]